jgi:hypothetical protein
VNSEFKLLVYGVGCDACAPSVLPVKVFIAPSIREHLLLKTRERKARIFVPLSTESSQQSTQANACEAHMRALIEEKIARLHSKPYTLCYSFAPEDPNPTPLHMEVRLL